MPEDGRWDLTRRRVNPLNAELNPIQEQSNSSVALEWRVILRPTVIYFQIVANLLQVCIRCVKIRQSQMHT